MRQNSGNRRSGRGRGRRQHGGNQRNHTFDSAGPDVRVRGTAAQVYEKYQALAREASTGGDKVTAESYWQFAEHYYRIMNANAPSRDDDDEETRDNESRQDGNRQRKASSGNGSDKSGNESGEDQGDGGGEDGAGEGDDRPQRRDRRRRRQQQAEAEGEDGGEGARSEGGGRRKRSGESKEEPAEGLMQTLSRGSESESEAAE
jgi:hypothetical protein